MDSSNDRGGKLPERFRAAFDACLEDVLSPDIVGPEGKAEWESFREQCFRSTCATLGVLVVLIPLVLTLVLATSRDTEHFSSYYSAVVVVVLGCQIVVLRSVVSVVLLPSFRKFVRSH